MILYFFLLSASMTSEQYLNKEEAVIGVPLRRAHDSKPNEMRKTLHYTGICEQFPNV